MPVWVDDATGWRDGNPGPGSHGADRLESTIPSRVVVTPGGPMESRVASFQRWHLANRKQPGVSAKRQTMFSNYVDSSREGVRNHGGCIFT